MELFTLLVNISCNLSHRFAKGTCGSSVSSKLLVYLQLLHPIWDHAPKALIQSIFDLTCLIFSKPSSIMIPWVKKIPSCMYRAMELSVPSPIDDILDRPILGHSILVCCPYLLLCLIHGLINVSHGQSFPIHQPQHLNKWLSDFQNLCCFFPK